jgi:hypothetical protein
MRSFMLASLLLVGCAGGVEEVGTSEESLKPRVCPAIAILCIEGYHAKQLPNCNQVCVPDNKTWECNADADCGTIYCITTPCYQPECVGHKCVAGHEEPGGGMTPCGNTVCGAGLYCCDAYCGTCAPEGYGCIQGCASPAPL